MKNITLTEREKNVIQHLTNGYNNEEISELLHISVHTTKAHLEAIYEKLNVHNRVQAVIKAVKYNLVDLEKDVLE